MEIWKDIPGYEGLYQASDLGRIKSLWFYSNYQNKKYKREKILKQKKGKDNCLRVELWNNKKHKTMAVHRIIGMAFLKDTYKKELTINHKDGNRLNNKVENLEWVSLADNIRHGFNKGLYSSQNKTKIIDKKNNKEYIFNSMSKAGQFIGHNEKYISYCISRNKHSNDLYSWELI